MHLVYSSLKNISILIARLINDNETISSLGKRNYKQYTIKAMTGNPTWFSVIKKVNNLIFHKINNYYYFHTKRGIIWGKINLWGFWNFSLSISHF